MNCVDGFVVPVPRQNLAASRKAGRIPREHGALEYIVYVANDVKPSSPRFRRRSSSSGEVVVSPWIV
ncbi:MAG: DUF1428 family protein [Lysobacterales bacterium]|jgi:uncharacterized protein YbaA (DUF1428 family)